MESVKLDLKSWPRAQHFEFFKGFSDPYFNITVNMNVKDLFVFSKNNGLSFFHSYSAADCRWGLGRVRGGSSGDPGIRCPGGN